MDEPLLPASWHLPGADAGEIHEIEPPKHAALHAHSDSDQRYQRLFCRPRMSRPRDAASRVISQNPAHRGPELEKIVVQKRLQLRQASGNLRRINRGQARAYARGSCLKDYNKRFLRVAEPRGWRLPAIP